MVNFAVIQEKSMIGKKNTKFFQAFIVISFFFFFFFFFLRITEAWEQYIFKTGRKNAKEKFGAILNSQSKVHKVLNYQVKKALCFTEYSKVITEKLK